MSANYTAVAHSGTHPDAPEPDGERRAGRRRVTARYTSSTGSALTHQSPHMEPWGPLTHNAKKGGLGAVDIIRPLFTPELPRDNLRLLRGRHEINSQPSG